jgi:16S rRNA (guanine1207-N2)-methyltransferase
VQWTRSEDRNYFFFTRRRHPDAARCIRSRQLVRRIDASPPEQTVPPQSVLPRGDAALETLFLPLESGDVQWPAHDRVLFLRARSGWPLRQFPIGQFVCEQGFRPFADALQRDGLTVVASNSSDDRFPLVLVLPPRQRDEARTLLARAAMRAAEGGVVIASMLNTEGARSGESDLARLLGPVHSLSKHHCRAFWATARADTLDHALLAAWSVLDAPRPIADGRFVSRPGLFAWDRIDAASALLASVLPNDLAGRGADLGAGYGYLSAEVLARCPRVTSLDLYEAEARALELAKTNLARSERRDVALDYFWHDVTTGLPHRYDFIVSNPPFHQGRADQPELGRAFIAAAGDALLPGGRLWLVANRHLAYESALAEKFHSVRSVIVQDGFKVLEAIKAR